MGWLVEGKGVDAARAEADARHLRDRYGAGAEAWCAYALALLPVGDPRRNSIQMIEKALQGVPSPGAGPGAGPAAGPATGPAPRHAVEPSRRF